MVKLWVVEAKFNDGSWEICSFGLEKYAHTNYYEAHEIKRQQQKYLKECNRDWYKNRFRVREYKAV